MIPIQQEGPQKALFSAAGLLDRIMASEASCIKIIGRRKVSDRERPETSRKKLYEDSHSE